MWDNTLFLTVVYGPCAEVGFKNPETILNLVALRIDVQDVLCVIIQVSSQRIVSVIVFLQYVHETSNMLTFEMLILYSIV